MFLQHGVDVLQHGGGQLIFMDAIFEEAQLLELIQIATHGLF